jgi:hypothetical protein
MSNTPNFTEIGGFVVALGALVASVAQYLSARRRELAWKRTEFIFAQCHYAENDPELREVTDILAGRSEISVQQILAPDSNLTVSEHRRLERALEKFLGLLDRLAYAVDHGQSLTISEIAEFGWHFRVVQQTPELRQYCEASYPCLLALAPRLQHHIAVTWPQTSDA